ncbi:hypothetical protein LCGC14_2748360, partial [marine sediment metagenome]
MELAKRLYPNAIFKIKKEYKTEYGKCSMVMVNGMEMNQVALIRKMIYDNQSKHKKIPLRILNSSKRIQESFLNGYYICDGLKQDKCCYKFKSIKSNSPLLCQGLLFLITNITKQKYTINVFSQNGREYYQINFNSNRCIGKCGKHLLKNKFELKKNSVIDNDSNCYVYDIETHCGYLNAGVGTLVVGNSPVRGKQFVTRKIIRAACRIKLGLQKQLVLGNLDARRDWGHSSDYTKAMIMILEHDKPDDFVIATEDQ